MSMQEASNTLSDLLLEVSDIADTPHVAIELNPYGCHVRGYDADPDYNADAELVVSRSRVILDDLAMGRKAQAVSQVIEECCEQLRAVLEQRRLSS
ncbi:hypothetical protein SEA_SCENTAE_233 [Gordonia phage SCentae]|nr:hypothetical protein SEA_SCENTAE_233 [Gordonia phage SCentae]